MSYEPTVWKDGDLVTSAKLNKLEQGIANSGGNNMVIMTTREDSSAITYTVDKTWQEIWDNNYIFIYYESEEIKGIYLIDAIDSSDYSIHVVNRANNDFNTWLGANDADSYPTAIIEKVPLA